ncbi:MAG: DNA alkylation repair protein [Bacteroidales bacterium]
MSETINLIKQELKSYSSDKRKEHSKIYFKTGKGEYGEGDKFLGISMPDIRTVVKKYAKKIQLDNIDELLKSKFHEERMCALLLLSNKFNKHLNLAYNKRKRIAQLAKLGVIVDEFDEVLPSENLAKECKDFYLSHTSYINNWDLVDTTCQDILGTWILYCNKINGNIKNIECDLAQAVTTDSINQILFDLSKSDDIWERRISIVTCIALVKKHCYHQCKIISSELLSDKNDLINKAVGWALREMGKVNKEELDLFLQNHINDMSRTTLRYAIEKYPENERLEWLRA